MTHRFTNCTFDLRGVDYACVSRGDEFEIGHIGEGDRVLIEGESLDFNGLHILGPVALEERIKAAVAQECYALTAERDAARETLRMFKSWDFIGDLQDLSVRLEQYKARAEKAEAERDAAQADAEAWARKCAAADEMRDATLAGARKAHDALWELNPNNYDHDEVCKLNDGAIEAILTLAPLIGETHGYSPEWWNQRAALQPDPDARQADLAKAFCMGRDAAADAVGTYETGWYDGISGDWHQYRPLQMITNASSAIRALTPPADLAAKIGGAK